MHETGLPIYVASNFKTGRGIGRKLAAGERQVVMYDDVEAACSAISSMVKYREYLESAGAAVLTGEAVFEPTRRSVKKHALPVWFDDAKLGVMVTWGPYSVPAFAPTGRGDIADIIRREGIPALYANQPYAEWYLNSLRIAGSPVQQYHASRYGAGYSYDEFAGEFNSSLGHWEPDAWADLFKEAGARYVVLITKHCDGFLLWPSARPHPCRDGWVASRDVVGELTSAVRNRGIRMGLYYSSALDWSFTGEPMRDAADLISSGPETREYAEYVDFHWRELIDRYEPSVLWGDVGYPPGTNLFSLFAFYYNRVHDGVVNDRWSQVPGVVRRMVRSAPGRLVTERVARRMFLRGAAAPGASHGDYATPEYVVFPGVARSKWECVRGIGRSFSYNAEETEEDYASVADLVHLLVDVVSKNGNLLLGVGPTADGQVPEPQRQRLLGLGEWLSVNGEAIFGTRPWSRAGSETRDGIGIRFTSKGGVLYTTALGWPVGADLAIRSLRLPEGATVRFLGREGAVRWRQEAEDLVVALPEGPRETPALALSISPPPVR